MTRTAPAPRARRRFTRVAVNVAGWAFIAAALAAAFTFRPAALGGTHTFTVVSGDSMEPTFSHGDLVITTERASYRTGDVVVYAVPDGPAAGRHIVHRLVDWDADGWLARGDNRSTLDPWRFDDNDIVGSQVAVLPAVGRWLMSAGSPWVLAGAAGVLVAAASWPARRLPAHTAGEQSTS